MGLEQLEDEVDRREQDSAPTTASTSGHNGAIGLVLAESLVKWGSKKIDCDSETLWSFRLICLFASAMAVQFGADCLKLKCSSGAL